jgi:hypothetical protein
MGRKGDKSGVVSAAAGVLAGGIVPSALEREHS